jgi:hypothetical protein
MVIRLSTVLVAGSVAAQCLIGSASAQSPADILPPGYAYESFESGWLGPGNNPTDVCAGLVRKKHGNRKYAITAVAEVQDSGAAN